MKHRDKIKNKIISTFFHATTIFYFFDYCINILIPRHSTYKAYNLIVVRSIK